MQIYRLILFSIMIACLLAACNLSGSDEMISETAVQELTMQVTQEATPTLLPTITSTPIPISKVEKGDQAFFNGDWDVAIIEYMDAWKTDPDPDAQTAALLGLGRTYYKTEEYAAALDALRRIKNSYPESPHMPETYFALAQVHEELDRYSEAADAFQSYLDLRPGLIDSYVHERRGDALTATGAYTMAINSYQEAIRAPRLDDVLPLEIKIGNSYYNLGDYQTALVVYSDIYTRTNSDYVKASMNFMTGLSHIQLGQNQEGYQAFLDSVENYPLSYDSYLGLINLVDAGYPVSEFDRGIVDYFAGQYSLAISAFDRYLLNPGDYAGTALYYKGLAYRAIDNPTAAINSWDQLIRNYPEDETWSDAWEQKGYTQWAFLDQYDLAQETFLQFVKNNPFNARAAEFLFFAGQVAERSGELDSAAEIWMRIPSEYPQSNLLPRAYFLTGINHYRLGDLTVALDTFQQALNYPGDRSALNFWIGKTYQAMGEQTAAEISWREAVGIDPTGYYSERARDVLLGREAFNPPLMYDLGYDPIREKNEAEDWMREVFAIPDGMDISSPGSLVNDPRWIRGTELWNLGLYEESKAEFEDLRSEISISPIDSYRLANYLIELGLYRPAIFSARQVLNLNDMDDADTMNAPIYFNHVRFGGYYKELVIPIAEAYELHPLFLFSVMRQESLFEGFVRSAAGARGLMQIMPATGDSIAANAGWPPGYTSEDLYRPKVSLTFGAQYLNSQRDYFNGQLYPALAAYNAGPGNASIWWDLSGGDPDLFLEIIRYDETRDYIRGIYEVFSIYRRLYDRTP
jgi:soluble lytic murein transglycosylase